MTSANKHVERKSGEDDKPDPNEAAERIEEDVRANKKYWRRGSAENEIRH